MPASSFRRLFCFMRSSRPLSTEPRPRAVLGVEGLSERIVPAVAASVSAQLGEVAMVSDPADNVVQDVGVDGDDVLAKEAVAMPSEVKDQVAVAQGAHFVGGSGNDALIGGDGRDYSQDDTVRSAEEAPAFGGSGNDVLTWSVMDSIPQVASAPATQESSSTTSPAASGETDSAARRSSATLGDVVVVKKIDKASVKL